MLNYVGLKLGFVCSVHKKTFSFKWWFFLVMNPMVQSVKIQETDMEMDPEPLVPAVAI